MADGNVSREAYTAGNEASLLSLDMDQCRCFHFLISGSSTLSADRGEEFGGRPGSLERRKVAGWTARKPGRACIFHLRQEPAKGGGGR